jgi:hypothetical protein
LSVRHRSGLRRHRRAAYSRCSLVCMCTVGPRASLQGGMQSLLLTCASPHGIMQSPLELEASPQCSIQSLLACLYVYGRAWGVTPRRHAIVAANLCVTAGHRAVTDRLWGVTAVQHTVAAGLFVCVRSSLVRHFKAACNSCC